MNKKFLAVSHVFVMLLTLDGVHATQAPNSKVLVAELGNETSYRAAKGKKKIFKGARFVCSKKACTGDVLGLAIDCALRSRLEKNCVKGAAAKANDGLAGLAKHDSEIVRRFFDARGAIGNVNPSTFSADASKAGTPQSKFKALALEVAKILKRIPVASPLYEAAPVDNGAVSDVQNPGPIGNPDVAPSVIPAPHNVPEHVVIDASKAVTPAGDSASKQLVLRDTRFRMHPSQENLGEILQHLEEIYGQQVENQSDEEVIDLILSNLNRLHAAKPLRVDANTVSAVADNISAIHSKYSEQDRKDAYHSLKLFVAFIMDRTRVLKNGKIVNFTDTMPNSPEDRALVKVQRLRDFQIDDKWITFLTQFKKPKKPLTAKVLVEEVIGDDVAASMSAPMGSPPSYEEAMGETPGGSSSSAAVKYGPPPSYEKALERLYGDQAKRQSDASVVKAIEAQARALNGRFPELLSGQSLTAVLKNMEQLSLMAEKDEKQSMGLLHVLKLLVALMQDRTRTIKGGHIVNGQLSIEDNRKRWSTFLNTLADTSPKAIEGAPYALMPGGSAL